MITAWRQHSEFLLVIFFPNGKLFEIFFFILCSTSHIADRFGPDLVSDWYCWLTVSMASGLSTTCEPGLVMMAWFLRQHATTGPVVFRFMWPKFVNATTGLVVIWLMWCWPIHSPSLAIHNWATKGSSLFTVLRQSAWARTGTDKLCYVGWSIL